MIAATAGVPALPDASLGQDVAAIADGYERRIAALTAEVHEYQQLAELMRTREQPWIRRWQEETGQGPLVYPDYGVILLWIITKAETAEAELARARRPEGG
jgi:hypothetical protein